MASDCGFYREGGIYNCLCRDPCNVLFLLCVVTSNAHSYGRNCLDSVHPFDHVLDVLTCMFCPRQVLVEGPIEYLQNPKSAHAPRHSPCPTIVYRSANSGSHSLQRLSRESSLLGTVGPRTCWSHDQKVLLGAPFPEMSCWRSAPRLRC